MQQPNVLNTLKDPNTNTVYEVVAYRALSSAELRMSVAQFRNQHPKTPVQGKVIRIISMLGAAG